MDKKIYITSCPLSTKASLIFEMVQNDKWLNICVKDYVKDLDDVEIFEERGNIIVTNLNYYLAFYADDVEIIK